jgi:predicted nucleic acid-binding protein
VIILDTNVVSAVMRDPPEMVALAWLDRQPPESVWTTSITIYELRFGIEILAAGRRRRALESALERFSKEALEGRVLPFDAAAADVAGSLAAEQRRKVRPNEIRDVQIAAIALLRKGILATRNVRHFADAGLTVVDPWSN